jgi:glycosyltransferase involved in cell wall biosynthesis
MTPDRPPLAQAPRGSDTRPFRVLATCTAFEPGFRGGGPVRSIAQTVDTVSEHTDVVLVTSDRDLRARDPYPGLSGRWVNRHRTRVFYLDTAKIRHWQRLLRDLRSVPFDLLYVNSLWSPTFTVIPVLAVRLGLVRARRLLIAPRGELGPGALALKSRKKRLFLKWWGPLLKSMDVVWQASTDREQSDIRAVFPSANVEISADPVSLPPEPLPAQAADGETARLVFIGRVSPMKNLALTLDALRTLSRSAEFDIYGPLEDREYWETCRSLIGRLPPTVQVRYLGELWPTEVPPTFANYDAFVFPTLGENFGHVIAESLSASCPVISSNETSWTKTLEAGGGRVVRDLTAESLGQEIERIVAMTPAERLCARQRAGDTYRSWRSSADGTNVLDQVRVAVRAVAR